MDKVRCSNCRGAKKVAKLGGMMGDCNLCVGTGLMDARERAVTVVVEPIEPVNDIVKAVSNVAAIQINKPMSEVISEAVVKEDKPVIHNTEAKKALYKRKSASK